MHAPMLFTISSINPARNDARISFLHIQHVDDIGKPVQLFRKFLTKFFHITAFLDVKEGAPCIYPNVHFPVRHERYVDLTAALVRHGRNSFHHLRCQDFERLSRIFRIYTEAFAKLLVIYYNNSFLIREVVAPR